MTHYQDRKLTCSDCSAEFIFEAAEQEFFASKRFPDPLRCKPCRTEKKTRVEKLEWHPAVCTLCDTETEVPFKPTPGRRVLCATCWARERDAKVRA
jgi:CxxC-x17-CxxC domain-containing protein